MAGRFQRGSCQRTTQVWLMEPDDPKTGRGGVIAQPSQGQLIWYSENDQGVRCGMPIADHMGMGDSEVQRRVCRLTSLHTRCQVSTGDQIQAGNTALAVRHARKHTRPGAQPRTASAGCSEGRKVAESVA